MKSFILFFIVLHISIVNAQESKILNKQLFIIDSLYQLSPQEKAFIHTSKEQYKSGEHIWFKVYTTVENQLDELSKVFYVDLIDNKDKVLLKTMWKVNKNGFYGDFEIPLNTPTGKYKLRVYSLWMLNTPESIDEKIISIISNNSQQKLQNDLELDTGIVIGLYPEGGNLVHGVNNKIAYKITNQNGFPIQKAIIRLKTDDGEEKIVQNPYHQGMGSFEFTPDKRKIYKFYVETLHNKKIINIPPIKSSGISLQINSINNSRIFYTINRHINSIDTTLNVYLIAHINGVTHYADLLKLTDLITGGAILKKNLPHGILTISILDSNMMLLAERLVFIKKVEAFIPKITIDKNKFDSLGKNELKIEFDSDSINVSVAISVDDSLKQSYSNNQAYTYFFLTSEIKGYVHEPSYYFESNDSAHNAALDLLILTQAYNRVEYENIFKRVSSPLNYFIETGISIRGSNILNKKLNINTSNDKINFIIKTEDSTTIIVESKINYNNKFILNNLDFSKRATIFSNNKKSNSSENVISFEPNYIDTLKIATSKKLKLNNIFLLDDKSQLFEGLTLANITVSTMAKTKEQLLTEQYATSWYQNSDFTIIIDSLTGFSSIWQYLQGMIPGLNISGDIFNPTVDFSRLDGGITDPSLLSESIYESLNTINGEVKSRIAFFLNEIPISMDNINSILPTDIVLVKVNRTTNIINNATAGSILVYTRKNLKESYFSNNVKSYLGYNVPKDIFLPLVIEEKIKNQKEQMSTLYWNPTVPTSNKVSKIIFYNNDNTKQIKITVEGLNKDGYPIFFQKLFN